MLQQLLDEGWDYHDGESARLADALEAAAGEAREDQLEPLLKLATHTIGEHLGDWPRARRLAEQVMAGREATPATGVAFGRLAVARFLDGDAAGALAAEADALAAADGELAGRLIQTRIWLGQALAGAGRRDEASAIYLGALALAEQAGDAAPLRDLAIASNNCASELVEEAARTPAEDALMRRAADAALTFWRACGTWVHEERALYLKALVANALSEPGEALGHADAALAIIAANGEQPVDEAFLRLARSRALAALGEAEAGRRDLAAADAAAADWDDPGLKSWFADERAKAAS